MFAISRQPLTQRDSRWEMFLTSIAQAYVDTLAFRVTKKVGKIKEKRRNQITCAKCFWWQREIGADGLPDPTKRNFGKCTNPRQCGEVLAFNPYKLDTKEEREMAVATKPIFTRLGQTCKYAKRKTDLRL